MQTVKLLGDDCILQFAYYRNGTVSIRALLCSDKETEWCVPTVNWEQNFEGPDYTGQLGFPIVVIKDYSENEGVFENLKNEGVIGIYSYLSGSNGTVKAAFLTDKWKAIAQEQLAKLPKPIFRKISRDHNELRVVVKNHIKSLEAQTHIHVIATGQAIYIDEPGMVRAPETLLYDGPARKFKITSLNNL